MNKAGFIMLKILRNRHGVSAVIVAIVILVLLGFAALAIDIGHLVVVRNELQNAADAGALNGARVLYEVDAGGNLIFPVSLNDNANAEARNAAIANYSDKEEVYVDPDVASDDKDVIRGNWDQDTSSFTECTDLLGGCTDDNVGVINAMRVTTHNDSALSFFANIFGISSFRSQASAVAYRGYAGADVVYDQPIAICRDSLVDSEGNFVCTRGRMFNSGGNSATNETSRWTNFSEDCVVSANAGNIQNAVCSSSSPLSLGSISTNAGTINPAMVAVRDCWEAATNRTESWEITLPVIECVSPPTCSEIVGAVTVNVVWITETGSDPQFNQIPVSMEGWEGWNLGREGVCPGDGWSRTTNCSGYDLTTRSGRESCWNTFVNCFNLSYLDESGYEQPAIYQSQTLYFVPACEFVTGGPGGEDFGVISEIPKLVE